MEIVVGIAVEHVVGIIVSHVVRDAVGMLYHM